MLDGMLAALAKAGAMHEINTTTNSANMLFRNIFSSSSMFLIFLNGVKPKLASLIASFQLLFMGLSTIVCSKYIGPR